MSTPPRYTIDPITEDPANLPLELIGMDDAHGVYLVEVEWPEAQAEEKSARAAEGERPLYARYQNRTLAMKLRLAEPSDPATTNLVTNPKGGVDAAGWTGVGVAAVDRVVLGGSNPPQIASVGADTALHLSGDADADRAYHLVSVTSGQAYAFQARVYAASLGGGAGWRLAIRNSAGTLIQAGATSYVAGEWLLASVAFTAPSGAPHRFAVEQVGSGTAELYWTAAMVEQASSPTAYFDGDTPGCSWTAENHDSASTRPAPGGDRMDAIGAEVEEACQRLTSLAGAAGVGGTLRHVSPGGQALTYEVVKAQAKLETSRQYAHGRSNCELAVEVLPFGSGEEVEV
jgi:hypothetical protein